MELWNGGKKNEQKSISIRIDENILTLIDSYAHSRRMSRSKAIISMLERTNIIIINEGPEIIKTLHSLDILLKKNNQGINSWEINNRETIEGVCNQLWQLLNLITAKIQFQTERETN